MNGHALLTWLQAHPNRLDLDVVLLGSDNWTTTDEGVLKEVDVDRFEVNEPEVICLSSYPPRRTPRPEDVTSSMFGNDTPMRTDG